MQKKLFVHIRVLFAYNAYFTFICIFSAYLANFQKKGELFANIGSKFLHEKHFSTRFVLNLFQARFWAKYRRREVLLELASPGSQLLHRVLNKLVTKSRRDFAIFSLCEHTINALNRKILCIFYCIFTLILHIFVHICSSLFAYFCA